MWHSAMKKKEKKPCFGLIGMLKEILRVAFEIIAQNCCEIWFHDVMSVLKKNLGMLAAG